MGVLDALLGEAFSDSLYPGVSPAQVAQTNAAAAKQAAGKRAPSGKRTGHAPAGPGGGRFISSGASGASVQGIQHRVGARVTGQYDSGTRQAVMQFQRAHGLQVDGVVGTQTAAALRGRGDARSVAPGALSAADVKALNSHGGRARTIRARVKGGAGGSRKGASAPVRIGGGYRV